MPETISTVPVTPVRVAVIASGSGSEVEVSQRSAANVADALLKRSYVVETFRFDGDLRRHLREFQPALALPVAHGDGEDGSLQLLFEELEIPYLGSGPESCALSWDKSRANAVVNEMLQSSAWSVSSGKDGLTACVPGFAEIGVGDSALEQVNKFCRTLDPSAYLVSKPSKEGSSIGVEFFQHPANHLYSKAEVVMHLEGFDTGKARLEAILGGVLRAQRLSGSALLQRAVQGNEITVAVFEQDGVARAFPVVEISTKKGTFYDFQNKYTVGASVHTIPARLPAEWLAHAQDVAIAIHRQLGCRDLSRVDFIVERQTESSEPKCLCFLELNSLPGFTSQSTYPEAAAAAGISMDELLHTFVVQALNRAHRA
jgi:D-alanine-D-alanine ligase